MEEVDYGNQDIIVLDSWDKQKVPRPVDVTTDRDAHCNLPDSRLPSQRQHPRRGNSCSSKLHSSNKIHSTTTTLDSQEYVPAHVRRWVIEMEKTISTPNSLLHKHEMVQMSCNAIESEVIMCGRRYLRIDACDNEESHSPKFGRHLFQDKNAHRVACLLASARLISSFSSDPHV
jgi:hypothetical protein